MRCVGCGRESEGRYCSSVCEVESPKQDKVSIVIPFNRLDGLQECIDSLMAQTYKNTEIILINDTQDRSVWEDVHVPEAFWNRTIMFSPKKKVYEAGARQEGLELATGEIILQTDSDAVYPPEFISLMELEAVISGANRPRRPAPPVAMTVAFALKI